MLWQAWASSGRRDALRFAAGFAASSAAAALLMEVLFRIGGLSYIGSLRAVHRDIAFTSVDDGWAFLPQYLIDVERLSGIVLIAGAVVYVGRVLPRLRRGSLRTIDRLVLPMLAAWVAQSMLSTEFHAIPLFGRLIHPWMPFLAWMLADSLAASSLARVRTLACTVVIVAAVLSWALAAREYLPLKYPPDVLYGLGIDTTRLPPERMLCELYPGTWYASPAPLNRATRSPYTEGNDDVLLNFCQALPAVTRPKQPAAIPAGATVVFDGPHWMTFPAYAYEGLIRVDREAIRRDGYRMQVFTAPAQRR
jgi:hypothetical protein